MYIGTTLRWSVLDPNCHKYMCKGNEGYNSILGWIIEEKKVKLNVNQTKARVWNK